MTDGTTLPEPREPGVEPGDDLVNAVLDGEATAAEAARVAADPRLAGRLEALRAVAHAVAAPVPVDPTVADRHVARAREAWGAPAGPDREAGTSDTMSGSTSDGGATVVDLAARRRRQTRLLGAAAAVLAVALLVPLVLTVASRSGDTSDETATRATPSTVADAGMASTEEAGAEGAADGAVTGAESGVVPSTATIPAPSSPTATPADGVYLGDLGEVPDTAVLRARVDAALATTTSDDGTSDEGATVTEPPTTTLAGSDPMLAPGEPVTTGASASCAERTATDAGVSSVRARAEVTLGGEPVVVYVIEEEGGPTVLVVDPATCEVRTRLPL